MNPQRKKARLLAKATEILADVASLERGGAGGPGVARGGYKALVDVDDRLRAWGRRFEQDVDDLVRYYTRVKLYDRRVKWTHGMTNHSVDDLMTAAGRITEASRLVVSWMKHRGFVTLPPWEHGVGRRRDIALARELLELEREFGGEPK